MSDAAVPSPAFGDYYREIYARGMLANEQPTMPVSWAELERAPEEALDLLAELDLTMVLTGNMSVAELGRSALAPAPF